MLLQARSLKYFITKFSVSFHLSRSTFLSPVPCFVGILLVSELSPSLGELGVNRIKTGLTTAPTLCTAQKLVRLSLVLFHQEK